MMTDGKPVPKSVGEAMKAHCDLNKDIFDGFHRIVSPPASGLQDDAFVVPCDSHMDYINCAFLSGIVAACKMIQGGKTPDEIIMASNLVADEQSQQFTKRQFDKLMKSPQQP